MESSTQERRTNGRGALLPLSSKAELRPTPTLSNPRYKSRRRLHHHLINHPTQSLPPSNTRLSFALPPNTATPPRLLLTQQPAKLLPSPTPGRLLARPLSPHHRSQPPPAAPTTIFTLPSRTLTRQHPTVPPPLPLPPSPSPHPQASPPVPTSCASPTAESWASTLRRLLQSAAEERRMLLVRVATLRRGVRGPTAQRARVGLPARAI